MVKFLHCSWNAFVGDVTWGSLPLMPPADLSISTSRCGTLRLHQRERTNEKYEKWPRWFQLHVAWSQGRDRYAALFYKMKEWVNGVREESERAQEKGKSRAGEGFLKGREQIDVECRFSTQVSKGKALETSTGHCSGPKGQIVFKKTNRGDKNYIHIYQNY